MTQYPLLFTYRDLVAGNGFLAGVAIDGRALIVEDDETWMYGVSPGGLSATGDSQKEAAADFRSVYRAALYDIAADAVDFEDFERQIEQFAADENRVLSVAWDDAVQAVRAGTVGSDWLERQPAESERGVRVIHFSEDQAEELAANDRIKRPRPVYNALDRALLAA